MPQYTTKQDLFHVLLYRRSSILQGICFLIRVYEYTKIKGLDSGKITSLPKSQNVINYAHHLNHRRKQTTCSSRVSLKFVYNESRHDSFAQFPRSPLGTPGSPTSLLRPIYKEEHGLQIIALGATQLRVIREPP